MKNNLKKNITRILACVLLIATLGLSLASCTIGDKVKDTADKAWDTAVDGAEKIYDAAKDKITMEQVSGMAAIKLLSDEETVAVPTYAGTLTASDLVDGAWPSTNGKGAVYIQTKYRVGHIASVTGAIMSDYWSSNAGSQPIVAVDGNYSYLCVLLPAGYTDAATWASAASDFSITVTPVIEKMLQATVLPEKAADKSVTWWVSCAEDDIDVSDYIRLLPGDDNKVTVLALQPFAGHEFVITCRTNVGGYSAECKVTYEGRASHLDFSRLTDKGDFCPVSADEILTFGSNSTVKIKLNLYNEFNKLGEKYEKGSFSIKSLTWEGTYVLKEGYWSGRWGYGVEEHTYDASTRVEFLNRMCVNTIDFEDDYLVIQLKDSIQSYDFIDTNASSRSFYVSGDPVCCVTIEDSLSGLSRVLRFNLKTDVESVSLSESNLYF